MISKKTKIFLNLLRVDNWTKNGLIFFPLFFGEMINNISKLTELFIAAIIFCILSSCVYIINDLVDAPKDRNHPQKKLRPIASMHINSFNATIIFSILFLTVIILSLLLLSKFAIMILCLYFAFNLLYTFWLKNILIMDIFSIAIFFEIRLFYGGVISNIVISHWLVLIVFFLASLIALGKRRDDTILLEIDSKKQIRTTAKYYNQFFLDAMIVIFSSLTVFVYIIYSISDWAIKNFSEYFYLSDIFVILALSKYLYLVFVDGKSGNPIKIILHDSFLHFCIILWVISVFYFIYYA